MNMSNEIILRSVYGKVNQIYFIQPCPNPKTGKLPACVKTVDSNGDMILSEKEVQEMNAGLVHYVPANHVFEVVDGTHFDLDDVVDEANWRAIEYCSWIAKERFERDVNGDLIIDGGARRYGIADLYVERPGELTKAKVNRKQLVFRACQYIYEDSEADRIKKCRVLGRNLNNAIPADILDFLIEKAERDPNKIIELYEGDDWKMQLFLLDAVDRGVIRKVDGIYKYDDKILGASIESTITFLRDIRFKSLLNIIKRETYPEFLTQTEIDEIARATTDNIPHFNEDKPSGEGETVPPKNPKTKK